MQEFRPNSYDLGTEIGHRNLPSRFDQLPVFPVYRDLDTEVDHLRLMDAVKARYVVGLPVEWNPDHHLIRRPGTAPQEWYSYWAMLMAHDRFARTSLVKRIVSLPRAWSDVVEELMDEDSCGLRDIEARELAKRAVQALKWHLQRSWVAGATYLMQHSSGFDSRLISSLLRQMKQEMGEEFGRVIFVCWQPEIEKFKKIMAYQGWPAEDVVTVYPEQSPEDYLYPILDMGFIGRNYDEAERFWGGPALGRYFCLSHGVYTPEQEDKLIGIGGLWSDETGRFNRLRLGSWRKFVATYLFDSGSPWIGSRIQTIYPFASADYVGLLSTYRIPVALDEFKRLMLEVADPEMADELKFPNERFRVGPILRERGYDDHQVLSIETVKRMTRQYMDSRFVADGMGPATISLTTHFSYFGEANTWYIKAAIYQMIFGEKP